MRKARKLLRLAKFIKSYRKFKIKYRTISYEKDFHFVFNIIMELSYGLFYFFDNLDVLSKINYTKLSYKKWSFKASLFKFFAHLAKILINLQALIEANEELSKFDEKDSTVSSQET